MCKWRKRATQILSSRANSPCLSISFLFFSLFLRYIPESLYQTGSCIEYAETSSHCTSHHQVVAAITYQIVPADTQYAEIPLAAVRSKYQRKVFHSCIFVSWLHAFPFIFFLLLEFPCPTINSNTLSFGYYILFGFVRIDKSSI